MKKTLIILFMLSSGFLTSSCSGLFYHPSETIFMDPKDYGFSYSDVYFKSKDGTSLHGWFFPAVEDQTRKGLMVQFHGNAENISTHFMSLAWITKHGYDFFTFDYRGYGKSDGKPSPMGTNDDALAALDYALSLHIKKGAEGPTQKIIAYGQSLGGTVLLRALKDFRQKDSIDSVVIDSSFSSYQEIGREKLSIFIITWPLQHLAYILLSDAYAPADSIRNISPVPLLVIHGDNDGVVPLHHGEKIFDLAVVPTKIWKIPGGEHIDSMSAHNDRYRKKLLEYIQDLPVRDTP